MNTGKVRQFCIEYNLYTNGDNQAYKKMFDMCEEWDGDTMKLSNIAGDIFSHSDFNELADYFPDDVLVIEVIAWLCEMLLKKCLDVEVEALEVAVDT